MSPTPRCPSSGHRLSQSDMSAPEWQLILALIAVMVHGTRGNPTLSPLRDGTLRGLVADKPARTPTLHTSGEMAMMAFVCGQWRLYPPEIKKPHDRLTGTRWSTTENSPTASLWPGKRHCLPKIAPFRGSLSATGTRRNLADAAFCLAGAPIWATSCGFTFVVYS